MELGEPIKVSEFISDDEKHDEKTCPWHEEPKKGAKKMEVQDGDEDAPGAMSDNSGKKLGAALTKDDNPAPSGKKVSVYYRQGQVARYPAGKKKEKVIRIYEEAVDEEEYDLQYAPHHLIPGNESLKGSRVVAFLGDDDVIENFKLKGKPSSCIKKDMSAGYDVNQAQNGEWLPSPYALSMSNEWPAAEGIQALRRREGDGEDIALQTEAFKLAYAVDAMNVSPKKQFHMRHADYSNKVREILDSMGAKLKLYATGLCPVAKKGTEDKKSNPPGGLAGRLDALSERLRGLLRGSPTGWRNPLFLDELTKKYFEEYEGKPKKTPNLKIM